MFRPRIIPVLLLKNQGLVKSIKFKDEKYIGDPINAVRIFNDLKADELVFLDILASKQKRHIDLEFVHKVGEEANMPFVVGGGIDSVKTVEKLLKAGAEKVIINTASLADNVFIKEAVANFGSSTVTVCMDVKKKLWGKELVYSHVSKKFISTKPLDYAKAIEQLGVGEIIVQSVDHDGVMEGYNYKLIESISRAVRIPIIALGGAGSEDHLMKAYHSSFANGLAAGSLFVYQSKMRGVLINYPTISSLKFD